MSSPDPALFHKLNHLTQLSYASEYTPPTASDSLYQTSLQTATLDLRRQILDLELQIASLKSSSSSPSPESPATNTPASESPTASPRLLRAHLTAYQHLFTNPNAQPPPLNSTLPPLLTHRHLLRIISQTLTSLPHLHAQLRSLSEDITTSSQQLQDQQALSIALQQRLHELQQPIQRAGEVAEVRRRTKELGKRRGEMRGILMGFLGRVEGGLEVEEMGGPVYGMGMETGRSKRMIGQRGIEEAFGGVGKGGLAGLLEELLERCNEVDEYVLLERESAAARFLVRAKAAEFHPRDARRIRLVDFGGGFE